MEEVEQDLKPGNAYARVVRIGGTVRKPWLKNSAAVQGYRTSLRAAGVDVPAPLGKDDQGRQIIEYVQGVIAMGRLPMVHADLFRVGQIVRQIHDASESIPLPETGAWQPLLPAETPNLMCHNDLAPWNLVLGERWVFIDWDAAGPSTRLWDLAHAAQSFAMLFEGQAVDDAASRLSAVVDGYGADAALRKDLPIAMVKRTAAMYDLLRSSYEKGLQPWADMYTNGHGHHWLAASEYILRHRTAWQRALGSDRG
ncbi:phosphotransferase [Paenarthrobacter sp. NPDC058040]|uniref:phosphotransferase n=1 Tax=unclassified Paenarthrobacter TaxID=2634190 RepID=UPI0036DE4B9D